MQSITTTLVASNGKASACWAPQRQILIANTADGGGASVKQKAFAGLHGNPWSVCAFLSSQGLEPSPPRDPRCSSVRQCSTYELSTPCATGGGRFRRFHADVAASTLRYRPADCISIAPAVTMNPTHPTLAPSTYPPLTTSDPFATPPNRPAELPAVPERAARRSSQQYVPYDTRTYTTTDARLEHGQGASPHKSASMSSQGTSSTMTPISSIDLEKNAAKEVNSEATRNQRQTSRDPEKAAENPTRHARPSRDRAQRDSSRVAYLEDDDDDEFIDSRQIQEKKAFHILLFLSGPCAILSFLNAIWTLISLFITLMTQPVRLCARRPSFGQQLGGLVGPALNLQLKAIYTPLPPHADEDTTYSTGMLVVVMLLSPILSMGMAFAAWVAAIFWMASAVVGDPAGLDKRDDGRETVLALRNFWERWLVRSMREW